MNKRSLVLLVAISSMFGCASSNTKNNAEIAPYEKAQLESKKETMQLLSKAALLAAKAQSVLAKTEQAYYQPLLDADQIRQARAQNEIVPRGMEKKIPISWTAAPEPVLAMLANASGYTLQYKNQRPPIPEDVYISGEPKNIKQLLDSIETQAEGYIKSIDTTDTYDIKLITVTYESF
jgi:hypothetical protein